MALDDPRFWLLAAIVAVAFAAEATTGFGATVIAVSLGVQLFPIHVLLPVIVPLGLVLSAAIAWSQRAHTDRRLLFGGVLPFMCAGLALGVVLFERASNESLRRAYGAFIVAIAAAELARMRARRPVRPLSPVATRATILGAGVIHGLFSSGGPLLVWAIGRSPTEKRVLRATLSTLWVLLASALTLAYAWNGRIDSVSLGATASLLPVLVVSWALGQWAHDRLDETRFRIVVYALLLAAGLANALR